MAAPWANDPIVTPARTPPPPSGGQPGLRLVVPAQPDQPAAQTPDQAALTAEQLEAARLENARREAEAARPQPTREAFQDESAMRREFQQRPEVQNYQTVLPLYIAARNAADTRAGDLNLTYAFGKIMDPGSVVRESEQDMVIQTGPVADRLRGIMSEIDRRGRLSPETRRQLIAELRSRRLEMARAYAQSRDEFIRMSQGYGFNPRNIVGEHPATPYAEEERRQREARGERVDLAPPPPERPEGNVAFWFDPVPPQSGRELPPGFAEWRESIQSAMQDRRFQSVDDLIGYARGLNPDFARTLEQPEIRQSLQSNLEALQRNPRARVDLWTSEPRPDISEQRGLENDPNLTPEQRQSRHDLERADATVRAAAQTATAGGVDYLAAAFGPDSFGENLWRERGITEYDWDNHTAESIAGTIGGGFLIPTGAVTAGRTAAFETIRAGGTRAEALAATRAAVSRRLAAEGGAYGFAHGVADSDGDLSDRVTNGIFEALTGAATSYGAGRFAPESAYGGRRMPSSSARPPLVDPVTERVNSPLDAAAPAERVAAAERFGIDLPLGAAGNRGPAIVEKGLDIVPGSAGQMETARGALRGQVDAAVEDVGGRYGRARTLAGAGDALQRGARRWISRFDEVSGKAYEAIPIQSNTPAQLGNARAALERLTSIFRSNSDMAEAFRNSRLEVWRAALERGGLSWEDLKAFRSRIGEMIGERRFSEDPATSQLRHLYGALSDDMRATAESQGPRALRAFERANDLYRQGQERIENALVRILGDDSRTNPERAAAAVQTIARSGRGSSNIALLDEIRRSTIKNGEWDEVAGTLIRLMGQPSNSAGREFNPQTFVQTYRDMSDPARNLLFGGRAGHGRRAELRRTLDEFVAVVQRLEGSNALRNTSQSAPGITAAGVVTTLASGLWNPLAPVKLAAGGAAMYGMGRLWTNPRFVRWATGYSRMLRGAASGRPDPAALQRQREFFLRMARSETAPPEQAALDYIGEQIGATDQGQR